MKGAAMRRIFTLTLIGLTTMASSGALAATIFKDSFNSGTVGTNVGAPWQVSDITPATYQTASSPFPGGSQYADLNDTANSASPAVAVRLLSSSASDATLTPSLSGQVTTFSFDFDEPTRAGDVNPFGFGYYRSTQADLNAAGRNYRSLIGEGVLSPDSLVAGSGAAVNYSLDTVNTIYMMVNDSAAAVANYASTGRTLAATTADVWISLGGAAPTFAFSVAKQNPTGTPHGVGFRTNNADIQRVFVDNVLVTDGATFDRTAVPEPASGVLASSLIVLLGLSDGIRRRFNPSNLRFTRLAFANAKNDCIEFGIFRFRFACRWLFN
jgi:hypothetical protein